MVGMGEVSHGLKFARKLRLNLDTLPLVVDSGPTFPLYAALGLHNEPSLAALYTNTVNARSILSASRSLIRVRVPLEACRLHAPSVLDAQPTGRSARTPCPMHLPVVLL